jgi:predicted esterase
MNKFIIYYFVLAAFISCCSTGTIVSSSIETTKENVGLKEWLAIDRNKRLVIEKQVFANKVISAKEAEDALQLIYEDKKKELILNLKESWEKKVFSYREHQMRIKVKTYGDTPREGHSLYISMHGGGGGAASMNDQQWENQIKLYQPEEGIYVAPRAPTNTWNLWHQGHIDPLFDQLIQAAIVLEGVNPNKVYLTGYSAGGDGTFQLAPRMSDRFAAAAMMAGHPNETTPDGLRNLPFALYVGELDAAYDRNEKAKNWKVLLDSLQKLDTKGYVHQVEIVKGKGHWMDRADVAGFNWMGQFSRNAIPDKIIWKQDDRHHSTFYWLEVPVALVQTGKRVVVEREGNGINIKENYSDTLILHLNDAMLNLDQTVEVSYHGAQLFKGKVERKIVHVWNSIEKRSDKELAFSCQLIVVKNHKVVFD